MSTFKNGDKVVYVGGSINPFVINPEINTEVVTIEGAFCPDPNYYIISEYKYARDGLIQVFDKDSLRKVSDIKDSREWAEKTLSEIESENTIPAEIPIK